MWELNSRHPAYQASTTSSCLVTVEGVKAVYPFSRQLLITLSIWKKSNVFNSLNVTTCLIHFLISFPLFSLFLITRRKTRIEPVFKYIAQYEDIKVRRFIFDDKVYEAGADIEIIQLLNVSVPDGYCIVFPLVYRLEFGITSPDIRGNTSRISGDLSVSMLPYISSKIPFGRPTSCKILIIL